MPVLHTNSSKINLLTAEKFTSNSSDNIIKESNKVNSMYNARGFNMKIFHQDNKFNLNALRYHIRPAILNIYAKSWHIPIINRSIQTIKQGERYTKHSVPYKRYTMIITRSRVECIIHSRNSFPQKGSIIKRLGSNTILFGKQSYDFNMKIILFGSYDMVYTGTSNTLKRRRIPSIALR